MNYIKGHTYRIAFAYANTHAWAEILNFFKLDLNWLTRPTLNPEPLIRQISKYVLYFKKSDNSLTLSLIIPLSSLTLAQYPLNDSVLKFFK